MSHELLQKRRIVSAADTPNVDGAGAVAEFVFGGPVRVTRVGLIFTTAFVADATVGLGYTMSRRPIVGSTAGAVTLGVFQVSAAAQNRAAGAVVFKDLYLLDLDGETAEDGTKRYEAPNANVAGPEAGLNGFDILPGQSFALTGVAASEGDSGAAISFVEVIDMPWNDGLVDQANIFEDVSDQD